MLAKISSEIPLPIRCWVMRSPIRISSTVPAVNASTIKKTLNSVKLAISRTPGRTSSKHGTGTT